MPATVEKKQVKLFNLWVSHFSKAPGLFVVFSLILSYFILKSHNISGSWHALLSWQAYLPSMPQLVSPCFEASFPSLKAPLCDRESLELPCAVIFKIVGKPKVPRVSPSLQGWNPCCPLSEQTFWSFLSLFSSITLDFIVRLESFPCDVSKCNWWVFWEVQAFHDDLLDLS